MKLIDQIVLEGPRAGYGRQEHVKVVIGHRDLQPTTDTHHSVRFCWIHLHWNYWIRYLWICIRGVRRRWIRLCICAHHCMIKPVSPSH